MILLVVVSLAWAALQLPFQKVASNPAAQALGKRAHQQLPVRGNNVFYLAQISVGTPPQPQTLLIDTGSSDFIVVTPGTCNTGGDGRAAPGVSPVSCGSVFDTTKSTTFKSSARPFKVVFEDYTSVSGLYFQDSVAFSGVSLDNINMVYATQASSNGVLGLGFANLESGRDYTLTPDKDVLGNDNNAYENFPVQLKTQGKISSTAYSLWLNDLGAPNGTVLFGGVDHSKYTGQLYSLPIPDVSKGYYKNGNQFSSYFPKYTRTIVTLNEISAYEADASEVLLQGAIPAMLDVGCTNSFLPSTFINSLAKMFNARADGEGGWYMDCGVSENAFLGFNFMGVEIKVPLRQFVRPFIDEYGDVLVDADTDTEYCAVGAQSSDESPWIVLGDNVLSSMYIVFDLETNLIALAPAVYGQQQSDIEDISGDIPRVKQAPAFSKRFTSHIQINASPTLKFTVSSVTRVPGETASRVKQQGLTSTSAGPTTKPNLAQVPTPANSAADGHGMTDIIGEGITTSGVDGVSTVIAGAPSGAGPGPD